MNKIILGILLTTDNILFKTMDFDISILVKNNSTSLDRKPHKR